MRFAITLALVVCQCFLLTYADDASDLFRNYYRYAKTTRSFYKINASAKTWQDAKETCESEGATFFYPINTNEADAVADLMKARTKLTSRAFVAASLKSSEEVFKTINGEPLSKSYSFWAKNEPSKEHQENCVTFDRDGNLYDEDCASKHPFICKKTLSSLKWDYQCNMVDRGYKYNAATGSCYKFHQVYKNWMDAYSICKSEMSHLAVINSQSEADELSSITRKHGYLQRIDIVHSGFHNMFGKGWTTVEGIPLLKSGYSTWAENEPNNINNNEKCGSMYYSGKLNDMGCKEKVYFICEHEVESDIDKALEKNQYLD